MNYRRYAMWMCVIGLLDLEAGQAAGGETSNDVVTAGTTLRQTSPSGTAYIMGKLGWEPLRRGARWTCGGMRTWRGHSRCRARETWEWGRT